MGFNCRFSQQKKLEDLSKEEQLLVIKKIELAKLKEELEAQLRVVDKLKAELAEIEVKLQELKKKMALKDEDDKEDDTTD